MAATFLANQQRTGTRVPKSMLDTAVFEHYVVNLEYYGVKRSWNTGHREQGIHVKIKQSVRKSQT